MDNKEAREATAQLKAVMPDHNRRAAEIIDDFERQHLIPEEMRAEWLRRCVEEQLWFVAETAKSFGQQEGYERALANDPLRRLLGTKAVEALLAGNAAVIPIHALMACLYRESADGYRQEALHRVRLDKPSESA